MSNQTYRQKYSEVVALEKAHGVHVVGFEDKPKIYRQRKNVVVSKHLVTGLSATVEMVRLKKQGDKFVNGKFYPKTYRYGVRIVDLSDRKTMSEKEFDEFLFSLVEFRKNYMPSHE